MTENGAGPVRCGDSGEARKQKVQSADSAFSPPASKRQAKARRNHAANAGCHSWAERGADLYETPPGAVRALLHVERLPHAVWEPACGPGAIVQVLRDAGHRVVATDLLDHGCPDSAASRDFLAELEAPAGVEAIMTNPPFKLADEFVRHALALTSRVIMLLRLAFLESERRTPILESGRLARVHVFRNRIPMMHRHGWTRAKASSSIAFAWFVFDGKRGGPPVINRISTVRPLNAFAARTDGAGARSPTSAPQRRTKWI